MVIKRFLNIFKRRRYTPAELSEFFSDKNKKLDTNISPENLKINTSKRCYQYSGGEKQAKYYRKKFGDMNKYDLAEKKVFDICFSISNSFYAYPSDMLAVLYKSDELKQSMIKVYYLLDSLKKEKSEPLLFATQDYAIDLKVNYYHRDRLLKEFNDFISFVELNEVLIQESLEMEELSEERIESTLERIRWLFSLNEEDFIYEVERRT